MACCILGAILIGNMLARWQKLRALFGPRQAKTEPQPAQIARLTHHDPLISGLGAPSALLRMMPVVMGLLGVGLLAEHWNHIVGLATAFHSGGRICHVH